MEEKNGRSPFLALAVATVVFAALGVIVYTQAPYKGVRPSVPEIQEPLEKIRARLWQDPFQAVLDHVKAREARWKPDKVAQKPADTKSNDKKTQEKEKQIKPDPMVAGVIDLEICHPKGELKDLIREKGKVTILGAMVLGGPYAEQVEFRIRQRYAVLSALNRRRFYPDDPEHIGCLKISNTRGAQDISSSQWAQEFTLTNIVPFEWLVNDDSKEAILLLWLNEELFYYGRTKPLTKLTRLKKYFEAKDDNVQTIIIGPTSSHTLLKMMIEILIEDTTIPPGMKIYSGTATTDNEDLLKRVLKNYRNDIRVKFRNEYGDTSRSDKERIKQLNKILEQRTKNKLERTICSDKELSKALLEELGHRNVDLFRPGPRDYVVLVSEWDTVYGRTLPETFKDVIRERLDWGPEEEISWVRRFSYLRGMDGKLPGEQNGSDNDLKKNDASNKDDNDLKKLKEPIGKGQYDYLRRLAENISRLNDQLIRDKEGSIKAIGVLGNDFYDKFLVLQALGQRFPEKIFFTTDLDARYLHPATIQWTRNLVVASTFGLQLHEDLQGDVPPFRDVYQTSVFAATLRAFGSLTKENFKNLKPRVFEIGQRNAIDLTGRTNEPPPINQALPVTGYPNIGWVYFFMIILVLSILLMLFWLSCTAETGLRESVKQFHKKTVPIPFIDNYIQIPIVIIWLSSFAFLSLIVWIYTSILNIPSEEPLYLLEGVSVWPAVFIRFVEFVLAVFLIIFSYKKLKDNENEIAEVFCLNLNCKERSKIKWTRFNFGENIINVNNEWEKYVDHSKLKYRFGWIILIIGLYLIFCQIIIGIFGIPTSPVRGAWSGRINIIILIAAVISFLFLTFFVLDTTMMLRRFIKQFSHQRLQWNPYSLELFLQKWIKKPELPKWIGSKAEEALSDWMLIQLIAKRTEVVGKLIYFPFIIWVLLFVSRLHYFDNWHTPLGLAIVIFLGAILAWSSTVVLRRSAEKLRAEVKDRLAQEIVGAYSAEPPDKNDGDRIKYVLQEIKDIRKGAFAPFLQQPALQSLFVLFAGIGGANLLDFFM